MEGIHHQRSSPSERFIGFFSSPPGTLTASNSGAGVELDEDDVLWTGGDSSSASPDRQPSKAGMMIPNSPRTFRRFAEKNFGILAALPEEDPTVLRRTGSSLSAVSSASSSPSSFARMIPVAPPRPSMMDAMATTQPQSAPVNVPAARAKQRRGFWGRPDDDDGGSGDGGTLPPHEMVARKDSPMTTFSVLEGAGRTLKGRDLRQVRNAVWRQTGFID
ncbi:senescence regulator (Protein of unknown function, DUF584) [Wolffia australiana]